MEAMWVANELVRSGEWQQLTGATLAPEKRGEKGSTTASADAAGAACPVAGHSPHPGNMFLSPMGRAYHPHSSLLQFTLFRMRTSPALNEGCKWASRAARGAVGVTCHLLALAAGLPLEEVGEGLLRRRAFSQFEAATAELQRVEYAGLSPAALTSFLINLHNLMVNPLLLLIQ